MGPLRSVGAFALALGIGFTAFAASHQWLHLSSAISLTIGGLAFLGSAIPWTLDVFNKVVQMRKGLFDIQKTKLEIEQLRRAENHVQLYGYDEIEKTAKGYQRMKEAIEPKAFISKAQSSDR